MALTQPILNSIAAFDATQEHIFSFISIGGDQVTGSQLTIYDNETGTKIYQGNHTSFKFEFPLSADILTNGKYYNATISTINNAGQFSEPSNPVAFYCYTEPVLSITNISTGSTIEQSNYMFQGSYFQNEGELLNGYQYTLYNSNKEKISQSAILYDGLYQYTFSGMANDTSYYVEISGVTVNNTPVSSGLILFTIRYIQPASFAICDLINNCQNGYIQISSNIVSIDGKSEPDPPKYIDDKEVDLTDEGNWVQWDEGFNIQNDFTMRIWGRSFKDDEIIVTMKNELDTETIPNRIEMKFMEASIVETLPMYIEAHNNIVTTINAVNEPITDLNIGGNGYQKVTQVSPTPDNPSEVYFTGDIGNQIDFPDTLVSYTDGFHVAVKPNNNYILLPNRIYTLNFDYTVINSTTDIYYGIGYGTKDNYVGALTINGEENIQYATQNTGINSLTFQTPATFKGVDTPYLWIDFAKTIITATVAVNVSNVSLYFGEYTPYQEYGKYNIPFKVLGQNLFNYQKLLYFIDNNTTHELISNGYSINPTVQDGDCYALIGYTNNFVPGEKYNLSYQTLGNLKTFNLYAVDKGTSDIVNEITLTNDVFVAPDNNYDLMLKFTLDSSSLTNDLNLWNIQIVNGEEVLDYAPYTETGLNMVFDEPFRGIENVRDYILLDTVNLLNPTTLRANVKPNMSYYFSNNTTNNYLLEFYNVEGNLIDSKDMGEGTFTTPDNCSYVTSEDFTITNVKTEQLQIEEGNVFSQYYPYIEVPSVVRYIGEIVLNGTENWTALNKLYYIPVPNKRSNKTYGKNILLSNYFKTSEYFATNLLEKGFVSETYYVSGNLNVFFNYDDGLGGLENWKSYLAEQYTNGKPVKIYYQLSEPQVYSLDNNYANALRQIKTQVGTNNIFIDSQYSGDIKLKYANEYTDQETNTNYVILKCWNENTIPYIIHSNYITVKSSKDKIFIWTRRKNNIFDLKIENLGEE